MGPATPRAALRHRQDPLCQAPRAVADAARVLTRFNDVRHVVREAVQRRACTVAEPTKELGTCQFVERSITPGLFSTMRTQLAT